MNKFISHSLHLNAEGTGRRERKDEPGGEKPQSHKRRNRKELQDRPGLVPPVCSEDVLQAAGMWMETKTEMEASRSRASCSRLVLDAVLLCTGDMERLDKFMQGRKTAKPQK